MLSYNYTDLRENLKSAFDKAIENHEEILVTRKNGENLVILSEEDYNSLQETAYILRSHKNAQRLESALESSKKTEGIKLSLNDLED